MREDVLELINFLNKKIFFLEDYLEKHSDNSDTFNEFVEGRSTAFHEIRSKLYEIL